MVSWICCFCSSVILESAFASVAGCAGDACDACDVGEPVFVGDAAVAGDAGVAVVEAPGDRRLLWVGFDPGAAVFAEPIFLVAGVLVSGSCASDG